MKLNSNQIEVLGYIVNDSPEIIEQSALHENRAPGITIGIAKFLLANDGNLDLLSDKQTFHFKNFILPLFSLSCDGVFGPETCTGNETVDEESLLLAYSTEDFLCQWCRYDLDNFPEE